MVSETSDVQAFLAQHPPFNHLSAEHIELAANNTFVAFSKSGDRLGLNDETRAGPKTGLLMVRSGSMEVRDADGVLVDRLSSGDYLVPSVLADSVRDPSVIVLEDSLYYELDKQAFQTLVTASPDMAAVCKVDRPGVTGGITGGISGGISGGGASEAAQIYSPQAGSAQAAYPDDRVRDVMSRAIVSAEPAMSIREAASLMKQHHISSLLIKSSIDSGKPLAGIVTDRDFRIRVLAEGVPDDAPIASVMTPDPQTIEADSKINDAQLRMMAEGIRHLPVIEHGQIVGMISQTDILHANNIDPISLIYAINRSISIEQLSEVAEKIPVLIAKLVSRDTRAVEIGKILTTLSDGVTRRLIRIAEMQYGPAPCAYAWLAFGSQARQEMALGSDQDNALLLADDVLKVDGEYFRKFAEFVNDGLNFCGMPYCPGDIMAKNEKWRQPLQEWIACFANWIEEPSPKAVMHSSIFFDMRHIAGDQSLTAQLHEQVLHRAKKNTIFQALMSDNALLHSPPLGFFKTFVLETDGDHAHMLDLKKRGTIPIVDIARNYALSAGLQQVNTMDRLHAMVDAQVMSDSMSRSLEDAHEFIAGIRLQAQSRQVAAGADVDNFLDPQALSPLVRHQLKDAFTIVREAQAAMKARFGGGVL